MSQGRIGLEKIYLKDLSFESPKSPDVFRNNWKPSIEMDINTRSRSLFGQGAREEARQEEEPLFEVVLTVTLKANNDEGEVVLLVEVQQGGIFRIEDFPPEVIQKVTATVCPNILFPYVRELIDSVAIRGGFPALHIAPVNFDGIYMEAMRKAKESAEQNAATDQDPPH